MGNGFEEKREIRKTLEKTYDITKNQCDNSGNCDIGLRTPIAISPFNGIQINIVGWSFTWKIHLSKHEYFSSISSNISATTPSSMWVGKGNRNANPIRVLWIISVHECVYTQCTWNKKRKLSISILFPNRHSLPWDNTFLISYPHYMKFRSNKGSFVNHIYFIRNNCEVSISKRKFCKYDRFVSTYPISKIISNKRLKILYNRKSFSYR